MLCFVFSSFCHCGFERMKKTVEEEQDEETTSLVVEEAVNYCFCNLIQKISKHSWWGLNVGCIDRWRHSQRIAKGAYKWSDKCSTIRCWSRSPIFNVNEQSSSFLKNYSAILNLAEECLACTKLFRRNIYIWKRMLLQKIEAKICNRHF